MRWEISTFFCYIYDDDHYNINMAPTTGVSHRQWVSGRIFKQQTTLCMGLPRDNLLGMLGEDGKSL